MQVCLSLPLNSVYDTGAYYPGKMADISIFSGPYNVADAGKLVLNATMFYAPTSPFDLLITLETGKKCTKRWKHCTGVIFTLGARVALESSCSSAIPLADPSNMDGSSRIRSLEPEWNKKP